MAETVSDNMRRRSLLCSPEILGKVYKKAVKCQAGLTMKSGNGAEAAPGVRPRE